MDFSKLLGDKIKKKELKSQNKRGANMRRSKKGTEKPIEIFVALFIILAVAMLLLKMMRDQTAGSEKQLKDAQRQQAMDDYVQSAQKSCNELCSQARDSGCSPKAMARFCLATYQGHYLGVAQEGYDVNLDNEFSESAIDDAGEEMCETHVYCSQNTFGECTGWTDGKRWIDKFDLTDPLTGATDGIMPDCPMPP